MAKTLQQEEFDVKHANQMEIAMRELMRRSHDTVRVYNPLDHTFSFMYDRFWHRVPAKSYKDMERYLAMKFFKNICDKMISDQIQVKGDELKALREKQMGMQFTDKYEENIQIWERTPKMNDPELMAQIFKTVIIGVVEEYGMQQLDANEPVPDQKTDYRPVHEQMFDSLTPLSIEDAPLISVEQLQGIEPPVYKSKATLAQEAKADIKEVLNES